MEECDAGIRRIKERCDGGKQKKYDGKNKVDSRVTRRRKLIKSG
jgi:hypothetical protein